MFNSTLKSSASQELFADGDHLISAGGKSYYRRPDISLSQRQQIAVDLLHREGEYGVVTPLSEMYRVSRTFMYDLRETARGALERALACGQPGRPPVCYCLEVDKNCVDRGIVTLATVGCCSIEQTQRLISEVLSVECSVGYISGVLQTAERRACEVNAGIVPQQGITVVADEIFDKQGPHLVVVEPHSLLILELSRQENRDSLTWGITLLDCAKRGVEIQTLVSDAAQGLKKGITETELGIEHQLDLFHTLREVMRVEKQLEREAYKAIGEEAERARVVVSAKSERVSQKRLLQWVEAAVTMEQKIETYEIYAWLVSQLREGLEFVQVQSGALQRPEAMSTLIGVVSELMLTIPSEKVRVVSEQLERQKGELVKYLEPLQEELLALKQQVGNDELVNLCVKEWRLERDVQRNRSGAEEALKQCQERLSCWKEAVVKPVRKAVQWLLGHVVRASSLVETVNSWLRPFLWRRKGNGRGIYNLLRFCWNTHRFFRGKRQGKTPLQLAGIEVSTDDWLQLLGFAPKSEKVSTNF